MKIIGINSGRAAPPRVDPGKVRPLADGSAALLQDGRIGCAAIEERFTRVRYSGGFRESLDACLRQGGVRLTQIDAVAHSTCCDSSWSDQEDVLEDIAETLEGVYSATDVRGALRGKVFTIDHHESHAALAFVGSGFARALVVVVDGIGNRIGGEYDFDISANWWRGAFQRHDVYLCEWLAGRVRIEKIHEDGHGLDEIGIGEIYRSVTHFLGWPTYQHAGKTMALAPFGMPDRLAGVRLIDFLPPYSARVPVANLHNDPIAQIEGAIRLAGYPLPEMHDRKGSPQNQFLCDVAAMAQQQVETALIGSITALAEKYGVTNIAIGGGVAMNCVALGKLAKARPDLRLYVPPAPADTGQALGNALWLAYSERSSVAEPLPAAPIRSAALGVVYGQHAIDTAVASFLLRCPTALAVKIANQDNLIAMIVDDLEDGKVVGLRQGRSEYGPRALGQASIIADPRGIEMHDHVNSYKRRESFRPYAPSIIAEKVVDYFEADVDSPFMSFAGTILEKMRPMVPAVVHIDGSARYQSVEKNLGFYRQLLEAWNRRTGIPVLLNTSFNQNGEPIVETPADTLDCFERSGLPVLVLGNWYVQRAPAHH